MASTSKALQDLDPNANGISQKRIAQCVGGGLWIPLPLPMVKGHPKDVSSMNAEELRKFFTFAYRSRYNKRLPKTELEECPPAWWVKEIGFDRFLVVKGNANESDTRKFLRSLVIAMYKDSGFSFLLSLATELNNLQGKLSLLTNDDSSTVKVLDSEGRTLIGFDKATMDYDAGRDLRKRGIFGGKENEEDKNSHSDEVVNLPKLRSTRTASAAADSNTDETKKQAQSAEPKTHEGTSKKRKLLDSSDDEPDPAPSLCKYCSRSFKYQSFCEEHEPMCEQGPPPAPMTMPKFMTQLGLYVTKDGPPPKPPVAPPVALPDIYYKQSFRHTEKKKTSRKRTSKKKAASNKTTTAPARKCSREASKHQQIVAMFKNNHLVTITSTLGQNLIKEHADKADTNSPPDYEDNCRTRSGSGLRNEVPVRDGEFPDVMKKAIAKDAIDPHIYTYGKGKSQRIKRYNELGVGLGINAEKFTLLNKIKPVVVKLVRLNTTTSSIPINGEDLKDGCLEKKFSGAIDLPKVRLIDCLKFPTPESAKYLNLLMNPAPQSKVAQPSTNNELPNDNKSSDSDEDLFVAVPRKKIRPSKTKESTRSRSSNSNVSSNSP